MKSLPYYEHSSAYSGSQVATIDCKSCSKSRSIYIFFWWPSPFKTWLVYTDSLLGCNEPAPQQTTSPTLQLPSADSQRDTSPGSLTPVTFTVRHLKLCQFIVRKRGSLERMVVRTETENRETWKEKEAVYKEKWKKKAKTGKERKTEWKKGENEMKFHPNHKPI